MRSLTDREPECITSRAPSDHVFVNWNVARFASNVLVVDPVLDDNEDDDCNNGKEGDDRFDHQALSLFSAETVDLAAGVPRQRAVEAATEGNRRNEREEG